MPTTGPRTPALAQVCALSGGSAEPMFRLIADGEVEMQGEILETALGGLEVGDPALLTVAGVGEVRGTGDVGFCHLAQEVFEVGDVALVVGPDHGAHPGDGLSKAAGGLRCAHWDLHQPGDALRQGAVGAAVAHEVEADAPAFGSIGYHPQFLLDEH